MASANYETQFHLVTLAWSDVSCIVSLESGGRVKEIKFSNNSTSADITDMLKHNFHQENTDEEISR